MPHITALTDQQNVCKRLGTLLSDARGAAVLATLQLASRSGAELDEEVGKTPTPADDGLVGIWQQDRLIGGFVRRAQFRDTFPYWADVLHIPRKSVAKRVVLIGESVARGYLYDPVFTPAKLLQGMLNGRSAEEISFEVIDLARTDLTAFDLVPLIQQAVRLQPDFIVLWAGNNWLNPSHYTHSELEDAIARVDRGYAASRRQFTETVLPRVTRRVVDALADARDASGAAGVVIIPEFNLRDWQSEPGVLLPYLPSETHVAWMRLRNAGIQSLEAEKADEALSLATEMIELDEGLSAVGHRLRAQALRRLNRIEEAAASFALARDACCGIPIPASPRCPAVVQQALRQQSEARGLACIDLPQILRRELDGAIPGAQVFLDYCHMNFRGLNVAMAATAACIRNFLGGDLPIMEELCSTYRESGASPTKSEQALAHFGAAIHNAHHGQSFDVMRDHCLEAITLDPEIASTMRLLLDVEGRQTPARWLCGEFESLTRSPILARHLFPRRPYASDKFADDLLHQAMRSVTDLENEPSSQKTIGVAARTLTSSLNLLEPQYHARTVHEREGLTLGPKSGFYTSTDAVTRFSIVVNAERGLCIQITYRMPTGVPAAGETCTVEVNGTLAGELSSCSAWRDAEILISASMLSAGANSIVINWPLQTFEWAPYREELRYCLMTGETPYALPVYGEIMRCLAAVR